VTFPGSQGSLRPAPLLENTQSTDIGLRAKARRSLKAWVLRARSYKIGIALLVELAVQAHEAQQPLMVCGLSEHDQRIFEITRLIDFMRLFPDEAQALAIGTPAPLARRWQGDQFSGHYPQGESWG
jgi:hypothetical protein